MSKNHMHIKCRFFSRKNLPTEGWYHPPGTINRYDKVVRISTKVYRYVNFESKIRVKILPIFSNIQKIRKSGDLKKVKI